MIAVKVSFIANRQVVDIVAPIPMVHAYHRTCLSIPLHPRRYKNGEKSLAL